MKGLLWIFLIIEYSVVIFIIPPTIFESHSVVNIIGLSGLVLSIVMLATTKPGKWV